MPPPTLITLRLAAGSDTLDTMLRSLATPIVLVAIALAPLGSSARADEGEAAAVDDARLRLECSLMPSLREQQIEGPDRDDVITRSAGVALLLGAGYHIVPWLEAGLVTQLDVGTIRYARYTRPAENQPAVPEALVEGGYWELWLSLMARAHFGPVFVELGWAPLILRHDASRTDLPNTRGETDGTFIGSRSVAWTLGLGGEVPLADDLALTLRLQFRIRYLISRGGAPLADEDESGQMLLWPYIGLRYAL